MYKKQLIFYFIQIKLFILIFQQYLVLEEQIIHLSW